MKEILIYVLGVVVCSGVFTMFYCAVLHRRTPFPVARAYLLASPVLSAVIPALDIPVWRPATVGIAAVTMEIHDLVFVTERSVDVTRIALWALWAVGSVALTAVMAYRIVRILRIKRRAEIVHDAAGSEIALSGEVSSPFSFLGTIFIGRGTPDVEMRQIILHESSHIRHRHPLEKLAMEVLKNILWFNLFGWWAARLLAEVHEFEADRDVLDGGSSTVEEYLSLIFRQAFGCNPELSVGLGDSLTKKRFMMMKNKMKLTRFGLLRVAGILPLAVGMMALFAFTHRAPEIIETPESVGVPDLVGMTVEVPTTQNSEVQMQFFRHPSSDSPDEEMPKFRNGGAETFLSWVLENIRRPSDAKARNQGEVVVGFLIGKDGKVGDIRVVQSSDPLLSAEIVRVVGSSPEWTPGKRDGEVVNVYFVMNFGTESESE